MTRDQTRRQLLVRSGFVAGALLLGTHASTTTATASTALDAGRRATFASLADVVLTGPAYRLDATAAQAAANDFATAYATWPADDRRRADRVLDELARRDRKGRERAVKPPGLERRELELAEMALALIAVATAPTDGENTPAVTA